MSEDAVRFERYKKTLLEIILQKLPDCKVYLFGSRARGDHQSGSDIDLALDNNGPIDMRVLLGLYNAIEDTTIPLTVDLVDLFSASELLKEQVKLEGILWTN